MRKVNCSTNSALSTTVIFDFFKWLEEFTNGEAHRTAMAIEIPCGALVEAFLERNYTVVFSINPKQLDRFRDRYSVAGAKDDSRDAFVAADSLRTDQHCFRRVALDDPTIIRILDAGKRILAAIYRAW
jgi:hypothetical protein